MGVEKHDRPGQHLRYHRHRGRHHHGYDHHQLGHRKGYGHYVENPKELPEEMRTGLVPPEKQKSCGKATVAGICLDNLGFHLGIVMAACWAGYAASKWFASFTLNTFNYKGFHP